MVQVLTNYYAWAIFQISERNRGLAWMHKQKKQTVRFIKDVLNIFHLKIHIVMHMSVSLVNPGKLSNIYLNQALRTSTPWYVCSVFKIVYKKIINQQNETQPVERNANICNMGVDKYCF